MSAATLVGAVLAAMVAHGAAGDGVPAATTPANILLITLDTTRADHLGCYGWSHAHTPVLDRLAARGCRFERAECSAPLTLPSHATMLTGLYPPRHGVRDNGTFRLAADHTTVAELLASHGWHTAAVVSAVVLARRHGLDRGFAVYDDDMGRGAARPTLVEERDAASTTDRALAALEGLRPPFFLWVHYFDPHEEYHPPAEWRAKVDGPTRAYDGEIAYVDHEIRRLLEAVGDGCAVVVVGDHGEMLGEHGEPTHGVLLHRAARRVPLIINGPGVPRGVVRTELVRTADVAPTLLELAGVVVPDGLDGASLRPLMAGQKHAPRLAYSEAFMSFYTHRWYPLRALTDGRWLYLDAPRPALYDLAADPGESRDVAGSHPEILRQWRTRLTELLEGAGEALHGPAAAGGAVSVAEARQLAALGYLAASPRREITPSLPDPRTMVGDLQLLHGASRAVQEGDHAEALPAVQRFLERSPHSLAALNLAGVCAFETGRLEQALGYFRRGVGESPGSPGPRANLAACLLEMGRLGEAEHELRRVLELDPAAGEAAVKLARLVRERGEAVAAAGILDGVLAAGGTAALVWLERGLCAALAGQLDQALASFLEAARRDPTSVAARENASRAAYALGRFSQAAHLLEQVVRLEADRADAWKTLGAIYLHQLDQREEAIRCFRAALRAETVPTERQALEEVLGELEGN